MERTGQQAKKKQNKKPRRRDFSAAFLSRNFTLLLHVNYVRVKIRQSRIFNGFLAFFGHSFY
jgi:hypothetical protein